ncbi:MAG: DUF4783 domain-containing protein [Flavobacteriales bacterium]|nr:DUF4783 domain-containing protein [Flavobacteriales bacterium]
MRHFISTLASALLLSVTLLAQNVEENIASAIRVGNHKELARHFDSKVDMAVLRKENSYSKAQAELIIKDFFEKNKVSAYQVIHRGRSRDGAQYVIGSLTTATGTYRTYVLTKGDGEKARIQQLRFEVSE